MLITIIVLFLHYRIYNKKKRMEEYYKLLNLLKYLIIYTPNKKTLIYNNIPRFNTYYIVIDSTKLKNKKKLIPILQHFKQYFQTFKYHHKRNFDVYNLSDLYEIIGDINTIIKRLKNNEYKNEVYNYNYIVFRLRYVYEEFYIRCETYYKNFEEIKKTALLSHLYIFQANNIIPQKYNNTLWKLIKYHIQKKLA